jgi:hypothetical protein
MEVLSCCSIDSPGSSRIQYRESSDTDNLRFACRCRTSSPSQLRLQAVLRSVKSANHGPIRASSGYSFIWLVRGGIGFIRVLGSDEYFPHAFGSDTHPRSWLKLLGESAVLNRGWISLLACAWCCLIQSAGIVELSFLPKNEHNGGKLARHR